MKTALPLALLASALLVSGCSSDDDEPGPSRTMAQWKPGTAVAVVTAEVSDPTTDLGKYVSYHGVISTSGDAKTLKIVFGRQAMLADLAAVKLELEKTPGVSNVREQVVAPR